MFRGVRQQDTSVCGFKCVGRNEAKENEMQVCFLFVYSFIFLCFGVYLRDEMRTNTDEERNKGELCSDFWRFRRDEMRTYLGKEGNRDVFLFLV